MCDEANLQNWAREHVSRRQFGVLSGAGVLAAGAAAPLGAAPALSERAVSFSTRDGIADGFFVHPAGGAHPAVILWPDIAGLREAKRVMARALAAQGYAVLVMNPYYRDVVGEQFADFADFIAQGGFQKVGPWRSKLGAEPIMRDTRAIAGWLDAQDAVDASRGIGAQGYCMGGPFTIWSGAAVPARVRAMASFHGGGLVGEAATAPVNMLSALADEAGVLIAIARNDDAKAPADKDILKNRAGVLGMAAEIRLFPADHGWMVPDSPAYAAAEARKGEAALLALYKARL